LNTSKKPEASPSLNFLDELKANVADLTLSVALHDGRFATVRAPTIKELLIVQDIEGRRNQALKMLSLTTLIDGQPITLSELLKLHYSDLEILAGTASKAMKL
jgi:hypothetical protein